MGQKPAVNRMSLHRLSWSVGLVFLLFLQDGSSGYNTDVPPPIGDETYAEVTSVSIAGHKAVILPLPLDKRRYKGARPRYGNTASVDFIKMRAVEVDVHVNGHIKQLLDGYTIRVGGKFNDVWHLRGNDAFGRLQGRKNHHGLFVTEASNGESFEDVVDRFSYINRS